MADHPVPPSRNFITIVSGLPRSGTSMMMQMLEAGGIDPLTDRERVADRDNPKGYYEFERAKKLPQGDIEWLDDARGRAVKVISALLPSLPPIYTYRVLMMRRNMEEILASQQRMLERRDEESEVDDATLADFYATHMQQTLTWLSEQPNLDYLEVNYNELVTSPATPLERIDRFLEGGLDAGAMAAVLDPSLYRQRK